MLFNLIISCTKVEYYPLVVLPVEINIYANLGFSYSNNMLGIL